MIPPALPARLRRQHHRRHRPHRRGADRRGKTVIVAEIIRRAENKYVLVLAHRRELIHQMRDKLADPA